jgi:aspartokinase
MTLSTPLPENAKLRVEKIGWDDSINMRETLSILRWRRWNERSLYVISAFKQSKWSKETQWNTTDVLIKIADDISAWRRDEALWKWADLRWKYIAVVSRELAEDDSREKVLHDIDILFWIWETRIAQAITQEQKPTSKNDYTLQDGDQGYSLMGAGEVITSQLYQTALWENISDFSDTRPPMDSRSKKFMVWLRRLATEALEWSDTTVAPWYLPGVKWWVYREVGRGYSDWTGAKTYSALRQIFPRKQFPYSMLKEFAMMSADPRIVGADKVVKIARASVDMLLDMCDPNGPWAPFVSRSAIMPEIFRNGGSMRIYTQDDPEWTLIDEAWDPNAKGIQYVQSRPIQVVSIYSRNMNRPGYAEKVSSYFRKNGISILGINDGVGTRIDIHLAENMKEDPSKRTLFFQWIKQGLYETIFRFEKDRETELRVDLHEKSAVYIGGQKIDFPGIHTNATKILSDNNINVDGDTQVTNPTSIAFLVKREHEYDAVRALHKWFIESRN